MTPLRLLAPSVLALGFVSCATHSADQYDTVPPQPSAQASAPAAAPSNPVYDTPAAYEEGATTAAGTAAATNPAIAPYNPEPPATTAAPTHTAPVRPAPAPAAPSNGSAIIHTVVAGDTLSGIAAKYKVPAAAIKQANNMTKDTVILGRKMVIPPVR